MVCFPVSLLRILCHMYLYILRACGRGDLLSAFYLYAAFQKTLHSLVLTLVELGVRVCREPTVDGDVRILMYSNVWSVTYGIYARTSRRYGSKGEKRSPVSSNVSLSLWGLLPSLRRYIHTLQRMFVYRHMYVYAYS